MRTWIFQGNPDEFDLDAYLATAPAQLPWLVTRYADHISAGDRVYIWRSQGKHKAIAGVIAEAEIISPGALRSESPDAVPFWRADAPEAIERRTRALLRLVRVATARQVVRRDWCVEDPILQTLPNLKMAAGTKPAGGAGYDAVQGAGLKPDAGRNAASDCELAAHVRTERLALPVRPARLRNAGAEGGNPAERPLEIGRIVASVSGICLEVAHA